MDQEADAATVSSSPNHTIAKTPLTANTTGAAQVLVLTKQSDTKVHILYQP